VDLAWADVHDRARGQFQALEVHGMAAFPRRAEEEMVEVGPPGTLEVRLGGPCQNAPRVTASRQSPGQAGLR
jgi:hypothetical protein